VLNIRKSPGGERLPLPDIEGDACASPGGEHYY